MNASSPLLLNVNAKLNAPDLESIFQQEIANHLYQVYVVDDSCWLVASLPSKSRIAFRLAYSPNDPITVKKVDQQDQQVIVTIDALIGKYVATITLPTDANPVLRLTTQLTPAASLLFPYWPRDIVPLGAAGSDKLADGEVKVKQAGTRSGQLYFTLNRPKGGAVFYLQNLTALAGYNQQTETSAGETVGGDWPEIGFALPPTLKGKPLEAGKKYVLSDALITFDEQMPADAEAEIEQYLDMLAKVYLAMPKPDTNYQAWPDILDKGLKDLVESPGCWTQLDGNHYLNAYLCDYSTPPEVMVQLAVLLPLLDYIEWTEADLPVMKKLKEGLPPFYSDKYQTLMRWHPKVADQMEAKEEQMQPLVMDSWYLHHPLLNLSRLALKGDKVAEKLFVGSLDFAIKVAKKFDYDWPVFYKMDTMEVVKAETQPGKGGEKDVPGLYAHIMLQAYELTNEKKYLAEAERAAQKLKGLGFDLFYQANNTAFSAGALLRLYFITKKEIYKKLSYVCLANIFRNCKLWDCNYGYGKNYPSFFSMFPLNDAPYTAAYEEEEVFCAFHDYLRHADETELPSSLRILMAEYIRYLIDRACYYYPTMLPKDMLSEDVKTGEVDPNLWIALEDLHDGWEKSGEVGQEVYGAGNAFGILPRHYMQVKDESFMIYTDYPTKGFEATKKRPVKFKLVGDGRLTSKMMIISRDKNPLPNLVVTIKGTKEPLKGDKTKDGHLEFVIAGDSEVQIDWKP